MVETIPAARQLREEWRRTANLVQRQTADYIAWRDRYLTVKFGIWWSMLTLFTIASSAFLSGRGTYVPPTLAYLLMLFIIDIFLFGAILIIDYIRRRNGWPPVHSVEESP